MNQSNMYKLSVKQWNPYVGCLYNCVYCVPSFQAQVKRWAKQHCPDCYHWRPHLHMERLDQPLPRTGYMQFIFACANGDVGCATLDSLERIRDRMERDLDKTFLIQSKNPATFNRVKWPRNVILGTTLETNIATWAIKDCEFTDYWQISSAPTPLKRFRDFLEVKHPLKMVTIEPVLQFTLHPFLSWIEKVNPVMIWLGYNSKPKPKLPEPSLDQVKQLHWRLAEKGFTVILKTIRKAWWET